MWHEARKHEKKIRGMMIDYRRRAERRREFYESIRRDPASFLQIHGQQMKIHIDPVISQTAESSLVPWMGDTKNMIDRFDVRAHLDSIPSATSNCDSEPSLNDDQEARLNYERFRNLVQNDFLSITEQKYLNQIYLEERCDQNSTNKQQSKQEIKKKLAEKRAAIGYNYEDGKTVSAADHENSDSDSDCEEDFEDLDTTVHIEQLNDEMSHRINVIASKFGVKEDYFIKLLEADKEESEKLRIAKEIETEKAMFVGRKTRRERKDLKQQRLLILRSINSEETCLEPFGKEPMAKPTIGDDSGSESSDDGNDSKSEVEEGKIEFITCFGNSSDEEEIPAKKAVEKKPKAKKSKPKDSATKIKSLKSKKEENDNCPIFGPMLPFQNEMPKANDSDVKFHSSNNNQIKQRHYRYVKRSDDEDGDRPSPPYRIRRSPSVRRHRSSSSEDSLRRRSRSRSRDRRYRSSYRRRSRERRDRSRSRSRRRRSPVRRRRRSSSRSRRRSSSRSLSRRRSRDRRHRSRSRTRRRSPSVERRRSVERSVTKIETKKPLVTDNNGRCDKKPELVAAKSPEVVKQSGDQKTSTVEKDPPVKRYYRHDLANSDKESLSEEEADKSDLR